MKIISTILLMIPLQICGQTQFQRTIGGSTADNSYCMIQTSDGGYALTGNSQSFSWPSDMYIVKLDVNGLLKWTRNIGGSDWERGFSIIQTSDGGYTIAGTAQSFGAGGIDIYIVKLDSAGNLQWNRTIGGTGSESVWRIIQTSDGGYAVAGSTSSFGAGSNDIFILKMNSTGFLLWNRTIGGTASDAANSFIQTLDRGFALAGSTSSYGSGLSDVFAVKLDSNGSLLWSSTVGGINYDGAASIVQNTDSSYLLAGYTKSFGAGGYDIYLAKFTAAGNLTWTKTIGGANDENASEIIHTLDGGYALACFYDVAPYYGCIVKLNTSGNIQWVKNTLNDTYSIIQTSDGGYAVTGSIASFGAGSSDFCILKFDAGWNTCGSISTSTFTVGSGGAVSYPSPIVNSAVPTVTTPTPSTGTGGVVMNMCELTSNEQNSNEMTMVYHLSQNYPNPFNPTTKIKFDIPKSSFVNMIIFNTLGQEVATLVNQSQLQGSYEVVFDGSNNSSGVYFYQLKTDEFVQTKKMLLIK